MTHHQKSLIKFPCDFTLKIMGKSQNDFEKVALFVVKKHFPKTNFATIQKKLSKDNNYLSLSITVYVKSKKKLDALYQELSRAPEILFVL